MHIEQKRRKTVACVAFLSDDDNDAVFIFKGGRVGDRQRCAPFVIKHMDVNQNTQEYSQGIKINSGMVCERSEKKKN